MELYRFGAAAWCAASKFNTIPPGLMGPLFRAGDAVLRQFDEPFLHTLLHLNGKGCRDPRDKIYGALGLAPALVADKIVPDYNKSTEEVYTDAVVALCEATGRIDFLLACDLVNRSLPGPTWVPDWSVAQRLSPRWLLSTTLASSISVSTAELTNTPKPTLLVQGVECGTISSVRLRAPEHDDNLESLEPVIRSWAPECVENEMYINKKESLLDAFVKTVHWNTLRERCPLDNATLTLDDATEAIREILCAPNKQKATDNRPDPGKRSYKSRYREALGRVYIELNSGYMGMTSAEPEELDIVCVILGCPLPMILRPHSSGRYQVVGPAYIHGLMDAEGVLGSLPQSVVVQVGASSGWYGGVTFRNLATNETVSEDPRLGEVPSSWVRIKADRTPNDPLHFVRFRDLATGKTINGDPRLLPDHLRARGVPLKPLKLV
ncbi:hypothetical protein M409DRAFT_22954 [Zasmidium cellare ATCC 36951]|uniref:Heterokaryon incompatibility domain-containing protein n=1 Tax=Zasmidium cellare ATCC 36951 TaxID=1080233 RepID=A0A6A6CLT0_ZASCE|nr:uncharacterized protein M409DRAFT_22954 [Zasmidium cellare ATCC 36951]KAF2166902.1 hypothetical protein M409DRAFT_22954 [Zasmidium cellare ATCC 36951]